MVAVSLAFLAALLLAPGAARAADECGTISSTALTVTCSVTAYADGIIYLDVAPGAGNVATVEVPGGSTPWTVTSGSGTGSEANGITLDSALGAFGGLALTVGGASATANRVAITQRPGNANTDPNSGIHDNNHGIFVRQRGTGASTTTVTVHAGVTIGTSSAGMNRHGISIQHYGSGAATVTNAAEIHSTEAGIVLNRFGTADTDAPTTIDNRGAVRSSSGALYLFNEGTGASTITNSGDLTAASGSGIHLEDSGPAGVTATVENSGNITSSGNSAGIYVTMQHKITAGTNAGVSVTHSAGAIRSTGDRGIDVRVGGTITDRTPDPVPIVNTGAARITVTGGSVHSLREALEAHNHQAGDVVIEVSSGVTLTSTGQHGSGIFAYTSPENTAGGVTIDNAGTIASTGGGIAVQSEAPTGAGAISVTNRGDITVTGNVYAYGIRVREEGVGTVTVTNSGDVTARAGVIWVGHQGAGAGDVTVTNSGNVRGDYGISVSKAGASGDVTITTTGGSITAEQNGIGVDHEGAGDVTITTTGGSITATQNGIRVDHEGAGDVTVTTAGGSITAEQDDGIWTEGQGGIRVRKAGASGDVTITTTGGSITATQNGIRVDDHTGYTGDVTVTNGGDVTAERPIYVERRGSGNVFVTNTGGTVLGSIGAGIFAWNKAGDAGDVTVEVSGGTVRSTGLNTPAIHARNLGTGDLTVTIAAGATAISKQNAGIVAGLWDVTDDTANEASQIKVTQGGAILGRKGIDAWATPYSTATTAASRAATAQSMIGITWTGTFAAGTTAQTAPNDDDRFVAATVGGLIESDREVQTGRTIRYGSAAGIEAHVMPWGEMARTVAAGDDPGRIEDDDALALVFDTGSTDAALKAKSDALVAQFVLAANNDDIMVERAVRQEPQVPEPEPEPVQVPEPEPEPGAPEPEPEPGAPDGGRPAPAPEFGPEHADVPGFIPGLVGVPLAHIDTNGDGVYSEAEFTSYLENGEGPILRGAVLRALMAGGLSEAEKEVLRALATGDGDALTAALTAAGFTDDAADDDDYWSRVMALRNRYNVGNIDVAMNGGSIVSRGDGIRAYYATPHDRNGAISVTVAEGAEVTGARAGIWVANAGLDAGEAGTDDDILKQTVTVHGMVTGGTDAAVHLVGGGTLTVGETGKLIAGPGQPAILVNDPGRAVVTILGEVSGSEGAAAAVDLSGSGSLTVGPIGRVNTNDDGAGSAIRVRGGTYQVAVYATGAALTQSGVDDAIARVRGGFDTSAADGEITTRPDADGNVQEGHVAYAVVETVGDYTTGRYLPLALDPTTGEPVTAGNTMYEALPYCPAGQERQGDGRCGLPTDDPTTGEPVTEGNKELPDCPAGQERQEDGRCVTPVAEKMEEMEEMEEMNDPLPTDCDLSGDRCRLYEALPSALLAMNGLPTWEERTSAARDARGGWARVEATRGKWKADSSTQPDVAYDHHRHGVRAGMDFAMGDAGGVGVSVHGLKGSAEMAGVGEVDLSGYGVGVHGARAFAGGFHVDAQAAATWYEADLKSTNRDYLAMRPHGTLKNDVDGRGYALGVEVGKRLPAMGGGVIVTPRAGLRWSKVVLSDFTDETGRQVSVKDARSLKGRAGVGVEKALDGDGMDGSRLFGSLDVEQEFKEETEANVMGSPKPLKASAKKTRFRLAAGAVRVWGEGRYALQGSLGYTAGGGDNRDLGGGLSFAIRF